jgi:hypothetical protein
MDMRARSAPCAWVSNSSWNPDLAQTFFIVIERRMAARGLEEAEAWADVEVGTTHIRPTVA